MVSSYSSASYAAPYHPERKIVGSPTIHIRWLELGFMSRGLAARQQSEDVWLVIDRRDLRLKSIWRKGGRRRDDFIKDPNNAYSECENKQGWQVKIIAENCQTVRAKMPNPIFALALICTMMHPRAWPHLLKTAPSQTAYRPP